MFVRKTYPPETRMNIPSVMRNRFQDPRPLLMKNAAATNPGTIMLGEKNLIINELKNAMESAMKKLTVDFLLKILIFLSNIVNQKYTAAIKGRMKYKITFGNTK